MKKAIKVCLFTVITALLLVETYRILSWKDTSEEYKSATQQLYNTDRDLMDVIFVGSSHCYASVYPDYLWRDYGIAAFDMAVSGQDKDSAYYSIKEVLKTQSPHLVFVDTYALLYDKHGVIGNVYRNMLSMKFSSNSNALIKSYIDEDERGQYLLRWPIIHTRYRELKKYDFIQYEPSVFGRGGSYNWECYSYAEQPIEALNCIEVGELNEKNEKWLDELINLSQENNFQLVFFMAPFYLSADEQKIMNAAQNYVQDRDISFIDFNKKIDELGLDYSTDFLDGYHVNGYGAAKITDFFGKYIVDNFEISDHRGDEKYDVWDKSYEYYTQVWNARQLAMTYDLTEYINQIKSMKNITYVVSLDGTFYNSTLDFESALGILGISADDYCNGGKWVFTDSNLDFYMGNESTTIYVKDLGEDTLCINNSLETNGDDPLQSIKIGKENGRIQNDGLSIVVYDNMQKKVIDKKGYY